LRLVKNLGPFSIRCGAASYPDDASGPVTLVGKTLHTLEAVSPFSDKILILTEDTHARSSLQKAISAIGYASFPARDSSEAWSKILKERPWMAFVELKDEAEWGPERIKELKENNGDCIVVVMTQGCPTRMIIEGMKAGAYDYIEVPFDEDLVGKLIKSARKLYTEGEASEGGSRKAPNHPIAA